uniref:Ig-like domain-containing protein n=1 Tax=Salvator merianae TaxID=96440 RepID=A0A8D0B9H5_SALMN
MGRGADLLPWKLPWAVVSLVLLGACEGPSSHSLRYIATGLPEPSQGLPKFIYVGYVDGQAFVQYDSNRMTLLFRMPWFEEVEKEDPQYWHTVTDIAEERGNWFEKDIDILRNRYNQTGVFHTWQAMYGCEQREDGSTGGDWQLGYNGKDFIAFDKETLTWTAPNAQAQMYKWIWDAKTYINKYKKYYLEVKCIEELQKYLHYGNKTLLRTEPPKVKMTSKTDHDNMETLICRADGFYPKDIHAVWTRDGEVWEQETLHGLVAHNSDGTYHTWISTKTDPKDKGRFQCRVDHESWKDAVDFPVEQHDDRGFWEVKCELGRRRDKM